MESPAFGAGEKIPEPYTCDGENLSPPLRWADPPPHTRTLVLTVEDPDVPFGFTVTHWILYNIPATMSGLEENIPKEAAWQGMGQGRRLGGGYGYLGPCPPGRKAHRYYFRLFALSTSLDLGPGASRKEVMKAMSGRIIASAELMGTYARNKRKR